MKPFAIFLLISLAGAALADNNQAVRKELDSDYKAYTKCFQDKNTDAMGKLMTDDYTVVQPNGQVYTKAQVLSAIGQQMRMIQKSDWKRSIRSLTVKGKQATAMVDGNFKGTLMGPDSKPHQMSIVASTQDFWVKTAKGYKLQKSMVKKNKLTIDGKEMGRPG